MDSPNGICSRTVATACTVIAASGSDECGLGFRGGLLRGSAVGGNAFKAGADVPPGLALAAPWKNWRFLAYSSTCACCGATASGSTGYTCFCAESGAHARSRGDCCAGRDGRRFEQRKSSCPDIA